MSNSLIAEYRQFNPADTRSDEELIWEIGIKAQGRLDAQYPDFAAQFKALEKQTRMNWAPSLGEEFARGVARGVDSLQSTAFGAAALASDILGFKRPRQFFLEQAQKQQAEAEENAPTIQGWEDAQGVGETFRYLVGGAGEVVPSIAEAAVTSLAGAAAGTIAAPGPGTATGAVTGIIGRQALRSLIRKKIAKEVLGEAAESMAEREIGEALLRNQLGRQYLQREIRDLSGKYAGQLTTALNSYALSSGEIFSDIANDPNVDPDTAVNTSLLGGFVAAVPDTFLPSYVIGKYFRGIESAKPEVKKHLYGYLTRLASEAAKTIPMESATEGFQEIVNIAASKYANPETRDQAFDFETWTDEDRNRIRNAAILGGIGGGIMSPVAAIPSGGQRTQSTAPQQAQQTQEQTTTEPQPEQPVAPTQEPEIAVSRDYVDTAQISEQERAELQELARRDVAGELSVVERQNIERLPANLRNYYTLVRDALQRERDAFIAENRQETATDIPEPATTVASEPGAESYTDLSDFYIDENGVLRLREPEPAQTAEIPQAIPATAQPVPQTASPEPAQTSIPLQQTDVIDEEQRRIQAARAAAAAAIDPESYESTIALPRQNDTTATDERAAQADTRPSGLDVSTPGSTPESSVAAPSVPIPQITTSLPPEELLQQIDFEGSRTTAKQLREGRGAALTSFVDVSSLDPQQVRERIYPLLPKSGALGTSSRALVAFEIGNTGQVLVSNIFESGKKGVNRALRLGLKHRNKNNLDYLTQDFNLRPIGIILLKKPVKDFAVTYSSEEYNNAIRQPALEQMESVFNQAQRATDAIVDVSEIGAVSSTGEIENAPGMTVVSQQTMANQDYELGLTPLRSIAITREQTEAIVDAIGVPEWTNEQELNDHITTAIDASQKAQDALVGVLSANPRYGSETWKYLLNRLIEAYANFQQEIESGKLAPSDIKDAIVSYVNRKGDRPASQAGGVDQPGSSAATSDVQAATDTTRQQRQARRRRNKEPYSTSEITARREPSQTDSQPVSTELFSSILNRLAAFGVDIEVFQRRLDVLAEPFYSEEGGAFGVSEQGKQFIKLVLDDITNPTQENLITLLHEAVHYLFENESAERRNAIIQAISDLSDRALLLESSPDARIRSSDPAALGFEALQQERLAESIARRLVGELVNPPSVAQRIIQFIRDLYVRAAIAIQSAFFGEENVSPELAMQYFEAKARGMFSGSIIDFLGGPKLNDEASVKFFTPVSGSGGLSSYWNADTMNLEVEQVLPTTPEAMTLNMRYRKPGSVMDQREPSPDLLPENLSVDFAANNEVNDTLTQLFQKWNDLGLNQTPEGEQRFTYDDFLDWLLPAGFDAPHQTIQTMTEKLAQLNQQIDSEIRTDNLNEFTQREAALKTYAMLDKLREKLAALKSEADRETSGDPGSLRYRFDRGAERVDRLTEDYTNADLLFSEAKQSIDGIISEFNNDLKLVGNTAHKLGEVSQILRDLEGVSTVPRAYRTVVNQLYRRLSTDRNFQFRFMDILQSVADMNFDWQNMSVKDIKQQLRNAAASNPALQEIAENTENGRALFAIIASFARNNDLAMSLMELRRSTVLEERQQLNAALKVAKQNSRNALREARQMVNRLPRLAALANKILNALEKEKANQERMLEQLNRYQQFKEFYPEVSTTLNNETARMERILGAVKEIFEPHQGAKYIVPPSASATPEQVASNVKTFQVVRNGKLGSDLKSDLKRMQDWLDAHGPGNPFYQGAIYNRIQLQVEKILQLQAIDDVQAINRSITIKFLGGMAEKLRLIGHPAARSIARRINEFVNLTHQARADVDVIGTRFANAERDAMKALGFDDKRLDLFISLFYNKPLNYLEQRKDLQAAAEQLSSLDDVLRIALPAIRKHLMDDEQVGRLIATRPGAWEALERYYTVAAQSSDAFMKMAQKWGIKIEDSVNGIFRLTKGAPLFEMMRTSSGALRVIYERMRNMGWVTSAEQFRNIAERYNEDPDTLRESLAPLFNEQVWKDFVRPLAYKSGRALFYAPADENGQFSIASRENVIKAFEAAKGDIVAFAEHLYELSDGKTDPGAFVAETLDTLENYFQVVHKIHQEVAVGQKNSIESVQRLLMDARLSEEFPEEWLEYRRYDLNQSRILMTQLATHAAFGRNLEAVHADFDTALNALKSQRDQFNKIIQEAQLENPNKSGRALKEIYRKKAEEIGGEGYLKVLENAANNYATLDAERKRFNDYIGLRAGVALELKPLSEVIGTAAYATVQGLGTAIVDISSTFKPLSLYGVSSQAFRQIATNWASFLKINLGSFMEIFGVTMQVNDAYNRRRKRLGIYDSDAQLALKERINAVLQTVPATEDEGISGFIGRQTIRGARIVREFLQSGLKSNRSERLFPSFRIHAPFSHSVVAMHLSAIDGVWRVYEDLAARAVEFFNENPAALANENYVLTGQDLGYSDGIFLKDKTAFDNMKAKLAELGMPLETVAREFIRKRNENPNAALQLFTDTQFQMLATIAQNEITLEANIANTPSAMLTNPILHLALPLVGWSIRQTASVARSFRGPKGELDLKSIQKGIIAFAALMGVSIAWSMLRDEYDEEILGKKANVIGFGERPFLAVIDRMARVGQLGIAGDFINSFVNVDTNRPFSVDSRVFAINSLKSAVGALVTWYRQGEGTYASVWRPLAASLGGSGYLQNAQIINNLLGFDNPESRIAARINASNYLRAAGRELNLDVQTGRGMTAVPNKVSPWITEMVLAAYANDPIGFTRSFERAKQAAREEGKPDPTDYVKKAFTYRHPLRAVFRTPPTESGYQQLLRIMDEDGRRDVSQAVRLFNYYGSTIGVREYEGKAQKTASRRSAAPQLFTRDDFFSRATSLIYNNDLSLLYNNDLF